MPKQPPAAGLVSGWWTPGALRSYGDAGAVDAGWGDQSGNAFDFSQGTAANQPVVKHQQKNGLPAVDFDGSNDFLDGTDFDNLINNNAGTVVCAFYTGDVTTAQTLWTDNSGRVTVDIGVAGAGLIRCRNNDGAFQSVQTSIAVGWHVVAWWHNASSLRIYLDDPFDKSSVGSGTTQPLSTARLGLSSASTQPFKDLIGEVVTYAAALTDANLAAVFAYLMNRWVARGDPLAQMRDVASRRMVLYGQARLIITQDVPMSYLDVEMLDPVAMSHEHIPHPTGTGAGIERWRRRVLSLHERSEDLDADKLTLTLADRGNLAHVYREGGVPRYSDDPRREGVAISGSGAVAARIFFRSTEAFVRTPGDGRIVRVAPGVEAAESGGIFLEQESANVLARSSFVSGTAGLTPSGTGVNGSAIAVDSTAPLLFDTTITTQGLKYTAGSPHTADLYERWPASAPAFGANQETRFQIWRDAACDWRVTRSTDGNYWNDSSGAWQVAAVWNAVPAPSSPGVIERHVSKRVNFGPTGGTYTLDAGLQSGGTGGRTARIFHIQWEQKAFPTAVIVTDATSGVLRGMNSVGWWETTGRRVFPEARGTILLRYTPNYDAADLEAIVLDANLLFLKYGALTTDKYWSLKYSGKVGAGASRLEFEVKDGSVSEALLAQQLVAGTEYAIAARWTSSEGELGLPADTLSVFIDGVKGTDAVIGSRPSVPTFNIVLLGGDSGITGYTANGRIRRFFSEARVWSDEEIAAWSAS